MKTTKVILVAALMAFATIGFSQTDNIAPTIEKAPTCLAVKISFIHAMQNPALVKAMRIQLTPEFLQGNLHVYTVRVSFKHTLYYIKGTHKQWTYFFSVLPIAPNEL